jgi:riboflavin kinase / FMN adenylyltransferase
MAGTKPFGFFRDVLLGRFKARGVVIGSDFRFGANRSAGALELVRWGEDFEIPIWVISPVRHSRQIVSSTMIRGLMELGQFRKAVSYLGHPYLIAGKVIRGRGMGRRIGIPTANLDVHADKVLPRGVFAVRGWVEGNENRRGGVWKGVCNIGVRPTFGGTRPSVEVHFPGRTVNLRGRMLFVEIEKWLRGEKKFRSIEQLTAQIAKDIKKSL